jgi:hyperosmotically inducible protein
MNRIFVIAVIAVAVVACSRPPQPKTEGAASAGASRPSAGQRLDQASMSIERAAQTAALTARVKGALANDVGLTTLKIDVDSNDGVVTLKGPVDSQETRRRAQEVARGVDGVRLLYNQLVVNGATG